MNNTIPNQESINRSDAYNTIAELITDNFSKAIENVMKGVVDLAKGEPSSLQLDMPESDVKDLANRFLAELGGVDVSLMLLPTGRKVPLEKTVSPYILLPSGRRDSSNQEILAPSLSFQIKTKY